MVEAGLHFREQLPKLPEFLVHSTLLFPVRDSQNVIIFVDNLDPITARIGLVRVRLKATGLAAFTRIVAPSFNHPSVQVNKVIVENPLSILRDLTFLI